MNAQCRSIASLAALSLSVTCLAAPGGPVSGAKDTGQIDVQVVDDT